MLDYATIIRFFSMQGERKNSIANTLGTKWDTMDRILKFYTNRWGSQEEIPDDVSSETIGRIQSQHLMPDAEDILEMQRKERISSSCSKLL